MTVWSVISGVLSNGVWLLVCVGVKKVWNAMIQDPGRPARVSPARVMRAQFFGFLIGLVLSLTVASVLPRAAVDSWLMVFRILAYIVAGYCFVFLWGCFDVLFAFYPAEKKDGQDPAEPAGQDGEEEIR